MYLDYFKKKEEFKLLRGSEGIKGEIGSELQVRFVLAGNCQGVTHTDGGSGRRDSRLAHCCGIEADQTNLLFIRETRGFGVDDCFVSILLLPFFKLIILQHALWMFALGLARKHSNN